MNSELFKSILAMDSYNRGYGAGVNQLPTFGLIGNAIIGADSSVLRDENGQRFDIPAGFYGIAYNYNGETIISYRGTDGNDLTDIINGWAVGGGVFGKPQAAMHNTP